MDALVRKIMRFCVDGCFAADNARVNTRCARLLRDHVERVCGALESMLMMVNGARLDLVAVQQLRSAVESAVDLLDSLGVKTWVRMLMTAGQIDEAFREVFARLRRAESVLGLSIPCESVDLIEDALSLDAVDSSQELSAYRLELLIQMDREAGEKDDELMEGMRVAIQAQCDRVTEIIESRQKKFLEAKGDELWLLRTEEVIVRETPIADGGHATVFWGEFRKLSAAVKRYRLQNNSNAIERFKNEAELSFRFKHHCIVSSFGGWYPSSGSRRSESNDETTDRVPHEPFLVFELVKGGDLDWATRMGVISTRSEKLIVLHDIAKGLHYMHVRGLIHRDLKPENVLISRETKRAKVADFGLTARISRASLGWRPVRSISYTDPNYVRTNRCGKECDVYSFGVIAWQLFSRKSPAELDGEPLLGWHIYTAILDGRKKLHVDEMGVECPAMVKDLVDRCLSPKENARPQFAEILYLLDRLVDGSIALHSTQGTIPGEPGRDFVDRRETNSAGLVSPGISSPALTDRRSVVSDNFCSIPGVGEQAGSRPYNSQGLPPIHPHGSGTSSSLRAPIYNQVHDTTQSHNANNYGRESFEGRVSPLKNPTEHRPRSSSVVSNQACVNRSRSLDEMNNANERRVRFDKQVMTAPNIPSSPASSDESLPGTCSYRFSGQSHISYSRAAPNPASSSQSKVVIPSIQLSNAEHSSGSSTPRIPSSPLGRDTSRSSSPYQEQATLRISNSPLGVGNIPEQAIAGQQVQSHGPWNPLMEEKRPHGAAENSNLYAGEASAGSPRRESVTMKNRFESIMSPVTPYLESPSLPLRNNQPSRFRDTPAPSRADPTPFHLARPPSAIFDRERDEVGVPLRAQSDSHISNPVVEQTRIGVTNHISHSIPVAPEVVARVHEPFGRPPTGSRGSNDAGQSNGGALTDSVSLQATLPDYLSQGIESSYHLDDFSTAGHSHVQERSRRLLDQLPSPQSYVQYDWIQPPTARVQSDVNRYPNTSLIETITASTQFQVQEPFTMRSHLAGDNAVHGGQELQRGLQNPSAYLAGEERAIETSAGQVQMDINTYPNAFLAETVNTDMRAPVMTRNHLLRQDAVDSGQEPQRGVPNPLAYLSESERVPRLHQTEFRREDFVGRQADASYGTFGSVPNPMAIPQQSMDSSLVTFASDVPVSDLSSVDPRNHVQGLTRDASGPMMTISGTTGIQARGQMGPQSAVNPVSWIHLPGQDARIEMPSITREVDAIEATRRNRANLGTFRGEAQPVPMLGVQHLMESTVDTVEATRTNRADSVTFQGQTQLVPAPGVVEHCVDQTEPTSQPTYDQARGSRSIGAVQMSNTLHVGSAEAPLPNQSSMENGSRERSLSVGHGRPFSDQMNDQGGPAGSGIPTATYGQLFGGVHHRPELDASRQAQLDGASPALRGGGGFVPVHPSKTPNIGNEGTKQVRTQVFAQDVRRFTDPRVTDGGNGVPTPAPTQFDPHDVRFSDPVVVTTTGAGVAGSIPVQVGYQGGQVRDPLRTASANGVTTAVVNQFDAQDPRLNPSVSLGTRSGSKTLHQTQGDVQDRRSSDPTTAGPTNVVPNHLSTQELRYSDPGVTSTGDEVARSVTSTINAQDARFRDPNVTTSVPSPSAVFHVSPVNNGSHNPAVVSSSTVGIAKHDFTDPSIRQLDTSHLHENAHRPEPVAPSSIVRTAFQEDTEQNSSVSTPTESDPRGAATSPESVSPKGASRNIHKQNAASEAAPAISGSILSRIAQFETQGRSEEAGRTRDVPANSMPTPSTSLKEKLSKEPSTDTGEDGGLERFWNPPVSARSSLPDQVPHNEQSRRPAFLATSPVSDEGTNAFTTTRKGGSIQAALTSSTSREAPAVVTRSAFFDAPTNFSVPIPSRAPRGASTVVPGVVIHGASPGDTSGLTRETSTVVTSGSSRETPSHVVSREFPEAPRVTQCSPREAAGSLTTSVTGKDPIAVTRDVSTKVSTVESSASHRAPTALPSDVSIEAPVAVARSVSYEAPGMDPTTSSPDNIPEFFSAAQGGDAEAQFQLGWCYYVGLNGVSRDFAQAARWYGASAAQGHPMGQNNLGACYRDGHGVTVNPHEAGRWFRASADQGTSCAQYNLGLLNETGVGVPRDWESAVAWYRKAALQGHSLAQSKMGTCYREGKGVTVDRAEAAKWFRKAADQGDPQAQRNLGSLYEVGEGVGMDLSAAVEWYRKSAGQGDSWSQNRLGCCYLEGRGVKQDFAEAAKWFRMAADQGNADAQCSLGWLYKKGHGVPSDFTKGIDYYRRSADQGNSWGQNNLGCSYRDGSGVNQDMDAAAKWFREAANQGNASGQCGLGVLYEEGAGVTKDLKAAVTWYRKSAAQGNELGEHNLGLCYRDGKGVKVDPAEAAEWFRKAAKKGHAGAQCDLGVLYEKGSGVTMDIETAIQWYRKSALQGHELGQFNLGRCAISVSGDREEAKKWYRLAAAQGYKPAFKALEELESKKKILNPPKTKSTEFLQKLLKCPWN